jgi:hypothetical protein
VQFGPLDYLLTAYDERSAALLALLAARRSARPSAAPLDRLIHLLTVEFGADDFPLMRAEALPPRLAALGPAGLPPTGWKWSGDQLGYVTVWHPQTSQSFWLHDANWANIASLYQLPWAFFTPDLCQSPGGLLHGGLAVHQGRGYLFTAPPDGGKSTALSRMPPPWEVQSDDAALVWFDSEGELLAVPLPTWSALMGGGSALPIAPGDESPTPVPVAGLFVLAKAPRERLVPLPPIEAAAPLYRALCEHPAVALRHRLFNAALFHCAGEIARRRPAWRLELTRDGAFWDTLAGVV